MQKAFDKCMHSWRLMLLLHIHTTKQFDIYKDTSDFQLGACLFRTAGCLFLLQIVKIKTELSVMEKRMLSIVATLDKF